MVLTFRDTKGSPLTSDEGDANIRTLRDMVQDLIDNPPTAVSVSNITVSGNQMTVWLSDGSSMGPFALPVAVFSWRGEWLPSTGYFELDIVTNDDSIYMVMYNHTSGLEFDPDALSESDDAVYHLMWSSLSSSFSTVVTVGTDTRQPVASEAGSYFRCIHIDGCEVTIPTNATAAFQTSDELHFYQGSDNPVFFTAAVGVTISPYEGHDLFTAGRGRVVTLKYVGSNVWDIFGGLAVETSS